MPVPCVRAPREDGEATRQALAERDLVDDGHEIVVEDGKRARVDCLGLLASDEANRCR